MTDADRGNTPTPWVIERNEKSAWIIILGTRQDGDNRPSDGNGYLFHLNCAEHPDAVMFSPFLPEQEANAAFIVRAVNTHDDLVAALRRVQSELELMRDDGAWRNSTYQLMADIEAALSKASEEAK